MNEQIEDNTVLTSKCAENIIKITFLIMTFVRNFSHLLIIQ